MKVYARTREDILKDKADYDARYAAYAESQDKSSEAYRKAEDKILDPIKKMIEDEFSKFSHLTVRVRAHFDTYPEESIQLWGNVESKDLGHSSWSFEIGSEDGTPKVVARGSFRSSTPEGREALREMLDAIDWLDSVDWKDLIYQAAPDYESFFDKSIKRPEAQNYDRELLEYDLADKVVDKPVAVKGIASRYDQKWYMLKSATPKFYQVHAIQDDQFDIADTRDNQSRTEFIQQIFDKGYYWRMKKEKLINLLKTPLEIIQ